MHLSLTGLHAEVASLVVDPHENAVACAHLNLEDTARYTPAAPRLQPYIIHLCVIAYHKPLQKDGKYLYS